ncbi:CDP-alcohol phosphatidyltransferase family protein [Candidatus Poribacteria bacterium]|nr:CDP-alcohol phosphatidyltransferase family protein [Candidatus Poribacteria bacterium]
MQRCSDSHQFIQPPDIRISRRDFFYVGNIVSILRLLVSPFILFYVVHWHRDVIIILGSLAILSDALDGYLARRLNQCSNLGKILDPVADKMAIGAVILGFVLSNQDFPLWAFGIIIFRDSLIVVGNIILFYRVRIIAKSNWWGKCTSFFLSVALILYVFDFPDPIAFYVLCFSLLFLMMSSWSYSQQLLRLLQTEIPPHKKTV